MYEELAEFDVKELTKQLSDAFYAGNNDHAETLVQELQWRIANTSI